MFFFLILSIVFFVALTTGISSDLNNFIIVSETGSQNSGIQVNCPTGYTVTGGGFADKYYTEDDEDASYPKGNGWYCREDRSNPNSECYAVCWDSSLISTDFIIKIGNQESGVEVGCGSSTVLGGGFGLEAVNDDDQDASHPKGNGWYCEDDNSYSGAECYAVCGDAKEDYEMTCETVEVQGNFNDGVEVMCNAGTYLTSGGFFDASGNDDDQDYNHPIDNGWYCEEDRSDGDSVCYARCCTFEHKCVEDIQFGCWSGWNEVTGVCVGGLMNESRSRLKYDANVCGDFEDTWDFQYRTTECEMPCEANLVNTTWSGWNEVTGVCVGGLMNESRFRTQHDSNTCGIFSNITYTELRNTECEMPCEANLVNTTWSGWSNVSECVDGWIMQSKTRTEYDANSCGIFSNVTYGQFRWAECSVPCVPEIVNGSGSWINMTSCSLGGKLTQQRTWTEYDANVCGTFESVVHNETREINCSAPECCEDGDCEIDSYSENFCIGDDVYRYFYDNFCNEDTCDSNVSEVLVETCADYCSDGICKKEKRERDIRYNESWVERFEAVNYYENQGILNLNDTNVISLGSEVSDSSFSWWTLLPWLIVLLILILLILIIRFI